MHQRGHHLNRREVTHGQYPFLRELDCGNVREYFAQRQVALGWDRLHYHIGNRCLAKGINLVETRFDQLEPDYVVLHRLRDLGFPQQQHAPNLFGGGILAQGQGNLVKPQL